MRWRRTEAAATPSPPAANRFWWPPRRPERRARAFTEMDTPELPWYTRHGPSWVEARIELHRRLALPLACFALALVGIPLGVSSRKGGKSGGYVMAIFLAFFCYYLAFISLIGMARQRSLGVELAAWLPNGAFLLAGLVFLGRMERPGDKDVAAAIGRIWASLECPLSLTPAAGTARHFELPPALAAAVAGHLHPQYVPVLLRRSAGQLRVDDPGVHLLRTAQRRWCATASRCRGSSPTTCS